MTNTAEKSRRRRGRPFKTQAPKSDVILESALHIFSRHGFEGSSLRQIASMADVDVALLSYSFRSKLGLWQAVIDHISAQVVPVIFTMVQNNSGARTGSETFRHVMEQLIDLICDTPIMAKFMVKEIAQNNARSEYVYERLIKPLHNMLLPIVKKARDSGDIGDTDPELFFFMFTGSLAMMAAAQLFIVRFSPAAAQEESFRWELKRTIFGKIAWEI
ncbi:TetR/AcrR family transcriptional regulator [Acerihabitans arboris]|uniref:TetR family transcriptional regulator n=1 Tax=Acerihabitans arboris TaxID=2691583 RepID=A0A845SR51_9GAMM|nr:TetR/AcrR family transcriptional regulator [Acerihabitans arboris]NDL65832.1 TetR family transcriptional regulator [Acerihabitans arboris]